jgi:uncharacterized protein
MEKILTYDECLQLFDATGMLDNIREHSIMVARVSCAIAENLSAECLINIDLVRAGALLHDITKTRALSTGEHHAQTGGDFLREMGLPRTSEIVAEHVDLASFNPDGPLLEKEIVHYADKRVKHTSIVTLYDRIDDLLIRYGKTDAHRKRILEKIPFNLMIENKIRKYLTRDIEDIIAEIG